MRKHCVCFSVCPRMDGWIAELPDREAGPYLDYELALQVAASEALRHRRLNHPSRVAVFDIHGEIVAERCLCERFQVPTHA